MWCGRSVLERLATPAPASRPPAGASHGLRESYGFSHVDAKQATGQLITEIQIGQRMLGIIESSARYAQAMEAAARQRQQSYDDG